MKRLKLDEKRSEKLIRVKIVEIEKQSLEQFEKETNENLAELTNYEKEDINLEERKKTLFLNGRK
ncbi:9817_t:CDS:2 [Funneliformis caledonium]|uniref:9817_t:CDS:1 n=1 Tax=Funneliformis caledonium TaxID=1117310 RepID=A0A9N9C509_9GLOM|nr:9817_t:CDS:2 [Funneliformis caledonium]